MASSNLDHRMVAMLLLVLQEEPFRRDDAIDRLMDETGLYYWPWHYRAAKSLALESLVQREFHELIEQHLRYMEKAGLVRHINSQDGKKIIPFENYRLSNLDELNEQFGKGPGDSRGGEGRSGDGGGNRGGGGGGGGGGDDSNDDQGGGIREVLGHRTLFALPKSEFEDLVNGLFDGPGSP